MTDWVAVFSSHYDEMTTWARGFLQERYDPESIVLEAFEQLYCDDVQALNPVGLWKVATRRGWYAVLKRQDRDIRANRLLIAAYEETTNEPVFLTARPVIPTRNRLGIGAGYVLEEVECALDGCGNTLKPRRVGGTHRAERQQFCSPLCAAIGRTQAPCTACGNPKELRSCSRCTKAMNQRDWRERQKEAA